MLHLPRVNRRRRGVVLFAVLLIIVLLTLAAYKYNDWMLAESRAIDSSIRASQARAFALSGVHYVAAMLAADGGEALSGNPWDNADMFQHIEVPVSGQNPRTGRFSVLSLRTPDEVSAGGQPYRFGVTCESGKINLNSLLALDKGRGEAGRKLLMALPNMTDEIANAILDWIDPDETPRTNGAENEYYTAQDPPYRCKNGPMDSLEELLLVRGVTPQLLFGNDRNRNGVIDPDEGDGDADLGWQVYLTVYSREVNVDPDGNPRIFLGGTDIAAMNEKLVQAVGEELATFIAAAQLYGLTSSSSGRGGSTASKSTTTTTTPPSQADISAAQAKITEDLGNSSSKKPKKISSLWDLVNGTVNVTIGTGQQQKTVAYPSPLNDPARQRELMPKLWEYCTTSNNMDLTPRININTAPQAVLMGLKDAVGMAESSVSDLLGRRPQPGASAEEIYATPMWLLTELQLSVSTLKKMDPYITTRSQVYRMQVVGYFDKGGPTARVEAVVDTNQGRPRILYFRDVSELGKGFDLVSPAE